jgi:hypothetical protein
MSEPVIFGSETLIYTKAQIEEINLALKQNQNRISAVYSMVERHWPDNRPDFIIRTIERVRDGEIGAHSFYPNP